MLISAFSINMRHFVCWHISNITFMNFLWIEMDHSLLGGVLGLTWSKMGLNHHLFLSDTVISVTVLCTHSHIRVYFPFKTQGQPLDQKSYCTNTLWIWGRLKKNNPKTPKQFYLLTQSVFFHLFSHMNNIKYRISLFFSFSCLFLSHKSIHSHSQVSDKALLLVLQRYPQSVLLASVPWCTGWGNIRCWDIMGPLLKGDKIRFLKLKGMWKKSRVCHPGDCSSRHISELGVFHFLLHISKENKFLRFCFFSKCYHPLVTSNHQKLLAM